jgi:hypothetical protein
VALPGPAQRLLLAAERSGIFGRAVLRLRFSYLCAASRSDR